MLKLIPHDNPLSHNLIKNKMDNNYLEYLKRVDNLPEPLKKIVQRHWDETGRPISEESERLAIIDILNKNATSGSLGFKVDMNKVFSNQQFTDEQLDVYYKVFLAGVKYFANKMITEEHAISSGVSKKM